MIIKLAPKKIGRSYIVQGKKGNQLTNIKYLKRQYCTSKFMQKYKLVKKQGIFKRDLKEFSDFV